MTTLKPKKDGGEIPTYSLTGDLLAFHRCGLQYRYQNRGRLPPSTPVQLWAGGFMHGVMEEAFLAWNADADDGPFKTFPWSLEQSRRMQERVDQTRLRPLNIIAPSNQYGHWREPPEQPDDMKVANKRAFNAVNGWGPELFPLVSEAEVPLAGVRPMPDHEGVKRSELYEINGVIDVLAGSRLADIGTDNRIVKAARAAIGDIEGDFEIIIDYKASDRPKPGNEHLILGQYQLETYAWIRSQQEDALPVRAGILLYLGEMEPSKESLAEMAASARLGEGIDGASDQDMHLLRNYTGGPAPDLSMELRLTRSLVLYPIDQEKIAAGAQRFDATVGYIEAAVSHEKAGSAIPDAWNGQWQGMPAPGGGAHTIPDAGTCTACDHRYYCPALRADDTRKGMMKVPKVGG